MKDGTVVMSGSEFLKSRGLKRDKANYVTSLIKMRAELGLLLRLNRDPTVEAEINALLEFIEDSIGFMYDVEESGLT